MAAEGALGAPDEWHLLSEGGANVVFAYHGPQPHLQARVLRVKRVGDPLKKYGAGASLTPDEHVRAVHSYMQHAMRQLIGPAFVHAGDLVDVDHAFLCSLQSIYEQQRQPPLRSSPVDVDCPLALLLPNLATVPRCSRSRAVTVEIKPKRGWPWPANPAWCRFCLHKELKRARGKWAVNTAYCPSDLFSAQARTRSERIQRALSALISTPQNNLRIFAGNRVLFSHELLVCEEAATRSKLEKHLLQWFQDQHHPSSASSSASAETPIQRLLRLVQQALEQSGVLQNILSAQHVDGLQPMADFARAMELYAQHHFGSSEAADWRRMAHTSRSGPWVAQQQQSTAAYVPFVCRGSAGSPVPTAAGGAGGGGRGEADESCPQAIPLACFEPLVGAAETDCPLSPDVEASFHTLRRFMMAATADDCSILVSLAPQALDDDASDGLHPPALMPPAEGTLVDGEQRVAFRVSIVDLDYKSPAKIPARIAEDMELLDLAVRDA